MFLEGTLLEKLRKIEALHAGTTVDGEKEVVEELGVPDVASGHALRFVECLPHDRV
jgi:hypothetical protein